MGNFTPLPYENHAVFEDGAVSVRGFSGGKDSLTLGHITLQLGLNGVIDLTRLRVEFIDEEAIFPCVENVVMEWRELFLQVGARFDWYCLEVRHYSCLNRLENDESFICWDNRKSDVWVRQPPSFAIRSHPLHGPRKDTYQDFLPRINDGPHMTGVRIYESIQRRSAIAHKHTAYTQGKTVEEISRELGMKGEEIFRLSDFSRSDFLELMARNVRG